MYEIRLPDEVRGLLQNLQLVISMGIEGVPLACVGARGYMHRLMLWMLLPLFTIGVAAMGVAMSLRASRRFTFLRLLKHVTPSALRICFVAYPIVTNVAFEAFSCYEFEGGRSWLVADVLIECGTDEHHRMEHMAWAAIVIYPIGLIMLNAGLLFSVRDAIRSGMPTGLSKALSWLHAEFHPRLFWCRSPL